jgi:hypothetical protein
MLLATTRKRKCLTPYQYSARKKCEKAEPLHNVCYDKLSHKKQNSSPFFKLCLDPKSKHWYPSCPNAECGIASRDVYMNQKDVLKNLFGRPMQALVSIVSESGMRHQAESCGIYKFAWWLTIKNPFKQQYSFTTTVTPWSALSTACRQRDTCGICADSKFEAFNHIMYSRHFSSSPSACAHYREELPLQSLSRMHVMSTFSRFPFKSEKDYE